MTDKKIQDLVCEIQLRLLKIKEKGFHYFGMISSDENGIEEIKIRRMKQ